MGEPAEINNEEKKLDWMYKDSNQIVDKEEYLLGRKVDKQFENTLLPPGKSQECLPSSIFTGLPAESQVDVARKVQEDPLYLIKRKEIESREQLLKNPRKLKQLQEMVARQQAAAEKLKKKEIKKLKKEKLKDIDSILAKKCIKLFGEVDAKILANLESSSDQSSEDCKLKSGKRKKKKKKKNNKNLDKLIAEKYKRLMGNIDAKHLAEISSSSSSESGKESQSKKRSSSSDREDLSKRKKNKSSKETKNKEKLHSNDKMKHISKSIIADKDLSGRDSQKKGISNKESKTFDKNQKCSVNKSKTERSEHSTEHSPSSSEISPDNKRTSKHYKFSSTSKIDKNKRQSNSREFVNKSPIRKKQSHDNISDAYERKTSEKDRIKRVDHKSSKSYDDIKSKKRRNKVSSDDSSESDDDNYRHRKETAKRKGYSSKIKHTVKHESSSSSSSESKSKSHTKISRISKRLHDVSSDSSFSDISKSKSNKTHSKHIKKSKKIEYKTSEESSSSSSSDESLKDKQKKQYGLVLPTNYVPKQKIKEEHKATSTEVVEKKPEKFEPKRKLSEKEKELKLKEMMDNAKWRDDLRDKNIKKHEEIQKAEKDSYVYNKDFMRKQMAHAISQETVESRVKANINSIQRSKASMNENFARRK